MADMGFMPQVTQLLDQVSPGGRRMLFSATLDRSIDLLVRRYLHDPVVHPSRVWTGVTYVRFPCRAQSVLCRWMVEQV